MLFARKNLSSDHAAYAPAAHASATFDTNETSLNATASPASMAINTTAAAIQRDGR